MTRITNADHVLLLLRGHLERTQKARRKRAKPQAGAQQSRPTALERVERIAATDALSDLDLKKALISGLLADEFGDAAVNDANFQQAVDDIVAILERDDAGRALLDRACRQLLQN